MFPDVYVRVGEVVGANSRDVRMAPVKQVSREKRAAIVALREAGFSIREIAARQEVSVGGIHYILERHRETGTNADRPRSGAPRVTTRQEDVFIETTSKRDRFLTARQLRAEVVTARESVGKLSASTVRDRLTKAGLNGRVSCRKPLLREINRQKRLEWARAHLNWTPAQWERVLFTDESKYEIFGNRRRRYVRRRPGERVLPACVTPTVKHGGGSIMVWGSFAGAGVGDLIRIEGRMDAKYYHRVLVRHAVPSGLRLCGRGFVFQQDNDPKHTSNFCQRYLQSKEAQQELRLMKWPPQSPDCNPIELLWDELDRAVRSKPLPNAAALWDVAQREWAAIPRETLLKLIHRMPRVCAAVVAAKGRFFDETNI